MAALVVQVFKLFSFLIKSEENVIEPSKIASCH